MAMKLKKGDTVLIRSGKDRGKKGKITRTYPATAKIVVEGVNARVRHIRPRRAGEKGQRVTVTHPIPASRVMLVCPACSKGVRVGFRVDGSKKARVCKSCGADIA